MVPRNGLLAHDEDEDLEEHLLETHSIRSTASSSKTLVRPPTYYGDGPFEAPSSDSSEEGDALLEKDSLDEDRPRSPGRAEDGLYVGGAPKSRPGPVRYLVIALASLVGLSALIGIIASWNYHTKATTYRGPGARRITMDHVFNGTFSAETRDLHWVKEAGDGVFSVQEGGFIKLVDLKNNKTMTDLVNMIDVKKEDGQPITEWANWQLSADMKSILVKTDYVKQWRHSSLGNYYVHTIASGETRPLVGPSYPPTTAYAAWSPSGDIAFVDSGDLYLLSDASSDPIRVTDTGSATITNGIPDWVYEEEVFSGPSALWFSPTGDHLAFLSFDDTKVDIFRFEVFNPTKDNNAVIPYTQPTEVPYPKPGYSNPQVSAWVFDVRAHLSAETVEANATVGETLHSLAWSPNLPKDDQIIMEVAWVAEENLIVKEVNRNADEGHVVWVDLSEGTPEGFVVRTLGKEGEEGDEGWIEQAQSVFPIPKEILTTTSFDGSGSAYLDIVPTKDGFNHIALFNPADSLQPIWLTSGDWEVTGTVKGVGVNADNEAVVYFEAANPTSTARNLYSVVIPAGASVQASNEPVETPAITSLTYAEDALPSEKEAYYSTSFSPEAGFYLLSYRGPGVPYQKVVRVGDEDFEYTLSANERLSNATAEYEAPTVTRGTIEIDGMEFNYREIRPPRMDDSGRTKYAVLFNVYGGPGSQTVDLRFAGYDWHGYLACGLQYITVAVDGRGTGFKGRAVRRVVKGDLGFWETQDQVEAARIWAGKPYVDPRRIGIWGWSYGGFMAAKVVEADAGIHSLAMSVAPVTSWKLYDSIYTERYMNTPERNPGGYINASVTNVEPFKKVDYLLAHGTGDDNVHFANSAHLLDMFVKGEVRDYAFRMFVDSDHSIRMRGAYRELHEFLTGFLLEKWGKGGRKRGW
ncbi:dipeptidyl peptidase IV N-terminal region-domain-containing protein [Schizophyllum amplum]|uniref:Dipeptidyl peptidase IV N-terminal region-domain-containing protein n=1 Tax=Schizophyllum amplum TaxID=97359 RepID=A0A550C099_9AGAR|nr:dipeptidyl peptidase IV N-terminal region-domain-containing protein [Auriculariopsis ampla]